MNCPDCDRLITTYPCRCGYGQSITPIRPIPMKLYQTLPFGCTKAEFGLQLYETIFTIGGILGLDEQRSLAINADEGAARVPALVRRRQALQQQLATQLPLLTDTEMSQILLRYKWVVSA